MPPHKALSAWALALAALLATVPAQAQPAPAAAQAAQRAQVVIQVSEAEPPKWNLALNNARNLQAEFGAANVDIEIVAYGPGIGMLKADSSVGNRIDEALGAGVKVIACENTMRGAKLTKDDMLPKVGYVSSGVAELARKQQGWAYIRP